MINDEELHRLESLVWTGDATNIALAQQVAKSLKIKFLLPNQLKKCYNWIKRAYIGVDFQQFVQYVSNKELHLDSKLFIYKQLERSLEFLYDRIESLECRNYSAESLPEFLNKFKNLQKLYILDRSSPIVAQRSWELPQLQELHIPLKQLAWFQQSKQLKSLIINQIMDKEEIPFLQHLVDFPQLEHLALDFTTVAEYGNTPILGCDPTLILEKILPFKTIKALSLSCEKNIELPILEQFTHLEILILADNIRLENISRNPLHFQHLQVLGFQYDSPESQELVYQLSNLELLHLPGTPDERLQNLKNIKELHILKTITLSDQEIAQWLPPNAQIVRH